MGHWTSPEILARDGFKVQWHRHLKDVPQGKYYPFHPQRVILCLYLDNQPKQDPLY